MSVLLWVVLITAIAGVGGTGLGGVISAGIRKDSKKTVSLLLSFAAGVMLSVVCFDLIESAIFPTGERTPSNLYLTIGGVIFGFAIVAVLNWVIDKSTNHEVKHIDQNHPKTADDLDELYHANHYTEHKNTESERNGLFMAGVIMALAIALHNFPEGMVIGAAYVNTDVQNLWSSGGILLATVIGLHNIPEGMAVAVPLIAGGMKKSRAVLLTAASGVPTVIGAILGYWLGSLGTIWHVLSLGFASGAMLYVVFGELLPESILMWRSKLPAFAIMSGMICGLIIIFA